MLTTSRLELVWASPIHAPLLLELNKDPEVIRYTGDHSLLNLAQAQTQIKERFEPQKINYKMGRFLVFRKDGTFLGWCGLRFSPEKNEVDLGYRLMKKHWGQGYATEASQACLEYGFKTLGLKRVVAQASPENIPSIKVIQKLGFSFRGVVPENGVSWVFYEISDKQFVYKE